MIIGITGGTGSGKTTLLELLREQGATVLDCDAIYHRLLETDKTLLSAIETRFPGTVENGILDRKKLGLQVFENEKALQELNTITHSRVRQEVLKQLEEKPSLAVIDAIGLFESGLAALCDLTIAVTAPENLRIERLMKRDNIPESYARSRIGAQRSQEEFAKLCHVTLENNGSAAQFREKCLAFFRSKGIITV